MRGREVTANADTLKNREDNEQSVIKQQALRFLIEQSSQDSIRSDLGIQIILVGAIIITRAQIS